MTQLRGFQVHIWEVSVHFVWWDFLQYPLGVIGVWDPRQGVRYILRTVSPPSPP